MSGCNDIAPAASGAEPRDATRRAWIWFGVFVLIKACLYAYFEWAILADAFEDEDPFLGGLVLVNFALASIVLFIRSLFRRQIKPALIYVALFAVNFGSVRYGPELDLTAKAYFFSVHPEMCPQGRPEPGYRVFLCYKYWASHSREALALNPGGELSAPFREWPLEFARELFENAEAPVDECRMNKVKLLVKPVYRVSDNCWGRAE